MCFLFAIDFYYLKIYSRLYQKYQNKIQYMKIKSSDTLKTIKLFIIKIEKKICDEKRKTLNKTINSNKDQYECYIIN